VVDARKVRRSKTAALSEGGYILAAFNRQMAAEYSVRQFFQITFTILILTMISATAGRADSIQTKAPYAFLIDANTGKVLLQKNADSPMTPASTTKILTAEIIFGELAAGRLKLDDTMAISAKAAREGDADWGGSSMFAQANSRVRVEDLLRGLLIASGNDAAIALAEGVAGSEEKFAALMNKRAREIGMTRSTFTNPWGRGDAGQKVTPRDMARLATDVISTYPQYYKYFGETEFTWNNIRQLNRDPLLRLNIGADGLKTGHLAKSGFGLVGSAVQNGHRLILVINGLKSDRARADEAGRLLEWGFRALNG
jgi:D-alanyl-D-alanine carboxypeptidase (penicillin-binding protein 5/6)